MQRRHNILQTLGLIGLGLLSLSPRLGQAQESSSSEATFSAQRFRLAEDGTGLIGVNSGVVPGHLQWDAGLVLDYANNPLVLRRDGERVGALLAHRVDTELTFAIGFFDYFALEIAAPLVIFQVPGEVPGVDSARLDSMMTTGLSDLRIVPKLRILNEETHYVSLSVSPSLSFPGAALQGLITGLSPSYLGESGPSFIPELALSTQRIPGTLLAINLAYRLRGHSQLANLEIGDELIYRLGAGYDLDEVVQGLPLTLMAELHGATTSGAPFSDYATSPLEAIFAARYEAMPGLRFFAGAGAGLVAGYANPDFRLFGGLRFALANNDKDSDGIEDKADKCPEKPEDKDGFEDADGCPDVDNDADGLLDSVDKCPDQAEDLDGNQDQDGCPDPDNDADGILDVDDKCPDESGTVEFSGCNAPDSDGDGIVDPDDKCPDQAEDKDNFADHDGCPDLDNDQDLIVDTEDKCPDVAEDADGFEDQDGCPDEDNDKDTVLDTDDLCPNEAASPERAAKGLGCPPKDSDGDGLMDDDDKCPEQAEDMDGFEDQDGCPELDNDKDGIKDVDDKCPLEPEVINGFKDKDGCPDKGRQVVILKKDKIEILDKVYFKTGSSRILRKSYKLLNQVAQVLNGHDEIVKIQVEGHTDNRGRDALNKKLSQRRAESVVRYLIKAKVESARLVAVGFGEEKPIAPNNSKKGREQNRRVEFNIIEQK